MSQVAYVRLKPYDPTVGNLKERYRMGAQCGWHDIMFLAGQLMELDPVAAQYLKDNVRQNEHDPSSKMAFDVWFSKAECAKALQMEKMVKLGRTHNPLMGHNAGTPPKLKAAAVSNFDAPPATSAIEAEMMAEQVMAARDLGAETANDDFGDFAPESDDDLINAALPPPPQEVDLPPPLPPPARAKAKRKPPKKRTAKKPAKPPKPRG